MSDSTLSAKASPRSCSWAALKILAPEEAWEGCSTSQGEVGADCGDAAFERQQRSAGIAMNGLIRMAVCRPSGDAAEHSTQTQKNHAPEAWYIFRYAEIALDGLRGVVRILLLLSV